MYLTEKQAGEKNLMGVFVPVGEENFFWGRNGRKEGYRQSLFVEKSDLSEGGNAFPPFLTNILMCDFARKDVVGNEKCTPVSNVRGYFCNADCILPFFLCKIRCLKNAKITFICILARKKACFLKGTEGLVYPL